MVRERSRLQQLVECGRSADQVERDAYTIALVTAHIGAEDDFDLGQTAAYLQLAALDLGIGSCIAWAHYAEKVSEVLHLPAELNYPVVLSFGYPAPQHKPQPPKKRKPFEVAVFWEHWP